MICLARLVYTNAEKHLEIESTRWDICWHAGATAVVYCQDRSAVSQHPRNNKKAAWSIYKG